MDLITLLVIIFGTLITFGPLWFMPIRYVFLKKYKDGKNIKIKVEQIPYEHGMFGVKWEVVGPVRMWESSEKKSSYEFSSKSVDEAFDKAGVAVDKALKEMKSDKKAVAFPSYSYQINEHGDRVNMKEN